MSFNYSIGEKLSAIYAKEGIESADKVYPVVSHVFEIDSLNCGTIPETVFIDVDKYFELFANFSKENPNEAYLATAVIAVFDCVKKEFVNLKTNNILFDKEMLEKAIAEKSESGEEEDLV